MAERNALCAIRPMYLQTCSFTYEDKPYPLPDTLGTYAMFYVFGNKVDLSFNRSNAKATSSKTHECKDL